MTFLPLQSLVLAVDAETVPATLITPPPRRPGFLLLHGWNGTQLHYRERARRLAALGCIGLTVELRGSAKADPRHDTISPAQNLCEVLAAYDRLAAEPAVDPDRIGVVGSSYGGYLGTVLAGLRPVRWLGLRAPALYPDGDWDTPMRRMDRKALAAFRAAPRAAGESRALRTAAAFRGSVLLVESGHDPVVPATVVASYRAAFTQAASLEHHLLPDADHGLSAPSAQQDYTILLTSWVSRCLLALPDPISPDAGAGPEERRLG